MSHTQQQHWPSPNCRLCTLNSTYMQSIPTNTTFHRVNNMHTHMNVFIFIFIFFLSISFLIFCIQCAWTDTTAKCAMSQWKWYKSVCVCVCACIYFCRWFAHLFVYVSIYIAYYTFLYTICCCCCCNSLALNHLVRSGKNIYCHLHNNHRHRTTNP